MVRRKGQQPRAKSFDSKADAERWARALESEVDRRGALPDTRTAESMTLAQVLARYRDEVSPTKRGSVSEVARLNGIIRRSISYRTLATLSSADLSEYREQRLRVVAPATVIRELNLVSHALDTARKDWGVYMPGGNPCVLVRRPKPPRGRTRRLQEGEEAKLLAAADEGRSAYMRPLITLALETGMRRGELLSLRWENINLETRVAHLPLTKNGNSRDVPLSSRALETVRGLGQLSEGPVIHASPNAVRLAWEHLVSRAGIAGLRFHDLRHEAISRLFELGLDLMSVASISGHRELRMLSRYTHLRASDLARRLE
jgi:integrase